MYYKEKYTGGNTPPDCGSMDGHVGIVSETGEIRECKDCPFNEFGTGENGAKACKQKRRLYLLREGEVLPVVLTVPSTSVGDYAKFVMRLLSKGQKTSSVVTKFSLQKVQSTTGIAYSQVVYTPERALTAEERASVERMSEQVKKLAGKVSVAEAADTDE
jgi:CO/xanthine dehydrogenase FAD-binding subunit